VWRQSQTVIPLKPFRDTHVKADSGCHVCPVECSISWDNFQKCWTSWPSCPHDVSAQAIYLTA
jgi:aldehyde:ferredoxin oxidoreductase